MELPPGWTWSQKSSLLSCFVELYHQNFIYKKWSCLEAGNTTKDLLAFSPFLLDFLCLLFMVHGNQSFGK